MAAARASFDPLLPAAAHAAPELEVIIEVPVGSFVKPDLAGRIVFVSPLPCPYNYGAVPGLLGLEGDLLDAIVLGPRLPFGARLHVRAWGALTLRDRGQVDDKLVCSTTTPNEASLRRVATFLHAYARFKQVLNALRGRGGRHGVDGWRSASSALARARPVPQDWHGPSVPF